MDLLKRIKQALGDVKATRLRERAGQGSIEEFACQNLLLQQEVDLLCEQLRRHSAGELQIRQARRELKAFRNQLRSRRRSGKAPSLEVLWKP